MEKCRGSFWTMYNEVKYAEYYYWHYKDLSEKWNRYIKAGMCIASTAGVASWFIWQQFAIVWAIVIALSQVIRAIEHLFPFSRRITVINFFLPDLGLLINEIEHDWYKTESMDSEAINELTFEYKNRLAALESKYISDTYFPRNEKCFAKALKDKEAYFEQHYDLQNIEEMEAVNQ